MKQALEFIIKPHRGTVPVWAQFLEQLLGCSVDLIRDHQNLRPFFRQQINKDGIDIFTAA